MNIKIRLTTIMSSLLIAGSAFASSSLILEKDATHKDFHGGTYLAVDANKDGAVSHTSLVKGEDLLLVKRADPGEVTSIKSKNHHYKPMKSTDTSLDHDTKKIFFLRYNHHDRDGKILNARRLGHTHLVTDKNNLPRHFIHHTSGEMKVIPVVKARFMEHK